MPDVGEGLRARREELGLSLQQAQAATKIRVRYLQAIEEGRLRDLPAAVYARGFVRIYADFLGLDGSALAATVLPPPPPPIVAPEPAVTATTPATAAPRRHLRRTRPPRGTIWPLLLFAAAVLAALALTAPHGPSTRPAAATAPAASAPRTGAGTRTAGGGGSGGSAANGATAGRRGIRLVSSSGSTVVYAVYGARSITAEARTTARVWISATPDAGPASEGTLPAGASATWQAARTLSLDVGNPPGLLLTVDGSALGRLPYDRPVTLTFRLNGS